MKTVSLIIFDELHFLGQDKGDILEAVISWINYTSTQTGFKVRMLGFAASLATGVDVADWFGVKREFLFNFRINARPIPFKIIFKGFSE